MQIDEKELSKVIRIYLHDLTVRELMTELHTLYDEELFTLKKFIEYELKKRQEKQK